MTNSLKFLLVCEGPTDVSFLKRLSERIGEDLGSKINIIELSPQRDATTNKWPSHGWTAVRRWCETWKVKEATDLQSAPLNLRQSLLRRNWKMLLQFRQADGIIIQIDTDIAEEIRDLSDNYSDTKISRREFCKKAVLHWLGESPETIQGAYLLLPSYAIETWLLATHGPSESCFDNIKKPFNYENISEVEKLLLELGYSGKNDNEKRRLRKKENKYIEYADRVYLNLNNVKLRCNEANEFCSFLERKAWHSN